MGDPAPSARRGKRCHSCGCALGAETKRRRKDNILLCTTPLCQLSYRLFNITRIFKYALGPHEQATVLPVVFRGCKPGAPRRALHVYGKDYLVVSDALEAARARVEAARAARACEVKYNRALLNLVLCSPGYEAVDPSAAPFRLADYLSLHVACRRGWAEVNAGRVQLSSFAEFTVATAHRVVDEAVLTRRFMDALCAFLASVRAPSMLHLNWPRQRNAFSPDAIVHYCRFDLTAINAPGANLGTLARHSAREFMEAHYVKYFLAGVTDEPAAWPWLLQPLRVRDLWFERVPLVARDGPVEFTYATCGLSQGGLSQVRYDACVAAHPPELCGAQVWSRAVHLRMMRPWAIAATQQLLLVLHRRLPVDSCARSEVADTVLRHLVGGSRGMTGVCTAVV